MLFDSWRTWLRPFRLQGARRAPYHRAVRRGFSPQLLELETRLAPAVINVPSSFATIHFN